MTSKAEPSQEILSALSLEDMLNLYQLSQVIFALHDLKLPEYLHKHGAQSVSGLAKALGADSTVLVSFLEAATTLNLLQKDEQGFYNLTPSGSRLRQDVADSVIPLLNHHKDGYGAWNALIYTLQTGKPGFEQVYHTDIYQFQGQHPEKLAHFNRYMQQTTANWLTEVVEYYSFSGHVVDIGGNTGALMALLLQRFPDLQGTVFDLKQAVEQTPQVLSAAGVSERCQIATGSFFEPETIPKDGTIYLISRVLLNWSDRKAVEILKNCQLAMPKQSKLLILDFVLSDSNSVSTLPLLHSLHLGIMFGARTRKQYEFEELLRDAGYVQLHWIEVNETTFLLEASPG